jgi:hypothetical protein
MYAYMLWADTTAGIMKMRNGANSAWISLWELDGTFIATDISLSAGTAGAPSLYFTGDTNTGLFSPGADTVALATAGSNRLHITSAGLVGLGTASPGDYYADADNLVIYENGNSGITIASATTGNGGLLFADGTTGTSEYAGFIVYAHSDNSLQFGANAGEAFRVDSSKRLLVGTSTARVNYYNSAGIGSNFQVVGSTHAESSIILHNQAANEQGAYFHIGKSRGTAYQVVNDNDPLGVISFQGADGSTMRDGGGIGAYVDGAPGASDLPTRLVFSTTADGAASPTERMRISSDGLVSCSHSTANQVVINAENTNASFTSAVIRPITSRAAGTSCLFFYAVANSVNTFLVYNNGNVQNTNNSYAGISDFKLKENIVDATSQWSDIKALQVRKYNFKEETGQQTHTQIGLIAQEVELVSPGLVSESPDRDAEGNDLGTVTKSVNYSVLYMKAVKALQEAMERIEALEADVDQLKGA